MGSWPEVTLRQVRRALKGRHQVYEAIEYWVKRGWRVRGQGHKFALYPPDPGVRLAPPNWVRVDGSPGPDAAWIAKVVHRECKNLEKRIRDETS